MKPKELTKVCSDSSADMNLSSKAKEDHSAEKQSQLEATLLAQMSTIHQPPTHAHPQQQLPEDLLERRQKFYQHCQSLKSSPNPYQQQMLESLAKEMFERKRQLAAAAVMTSAAADKHDNVSFDPNLQLQLARFIQKSSEVCPSKLYGRQSQSFSMPTNRIPTVPQISPSVAGGSDQLKSFAKYFEMLKQSHTPVDYQFYLPNSPAAPSVIDHRPSVIRNFPFGPIFSPSQHSYNPAFIAGESQQGGIREPNAAGAGSLKLPTYHPS